MPFFFLKFFYAVYSSYTIEHHTSRWERNGNFATHLFPRKQKYVRYILSLENIKHNKGNIIFFWLWLLSTCNVRCYFIYLFFVHLNLVFTHPIDQYVELRGSMTVTNSIKSLIFIFLFFGFFFSIAYFFKWVNHGQKEMKNSGFVRVCAQCELLFVLCNIWRFFFLLKKSIVSRSNHMKIKTINSYFSDIISKRNIENLKKKQKWNCVENILILLNIFY